MLSRTGNFGTLVHYILHYLDSHNVIQEQTFISEIQKQLDQINKTFANQDDCIYTELPVFSLTNQIAGTIDKLILNEQRRKLWIVDYKTTTLRTLLNTTYYPTNYPAH